MIFLFVFLTYIIAWLPTFLTPNAAYIQNGDATMLVPGSVAIILTFFARDSLKQFFKKSALKNIGLAILIISVAAGIYLIIALSFSFIKLTFDPGQLSNFLFNKASFVGAPLWVLALNVVLTVFIAATFEEMGWRGYLQPRINKKIKSFLLKTLIVGVIWGCWELPTYPFNLAGGSAITPQHLLTILIFVINMILLSIIFCWLYEKQNSFWPTATAHTTHNLLFNVLFNVIATKPTSIFVSGEIGILVTISYSLVIVFGWLWLRHATSNMT